MISLELSTIQYNSSTQAMLDAAKAEFLAHGGRIQVLDRTTNAERPAPEYGYEGPHSVRDSRIKETQEKEAAEITMVREMAKTKTMRDVVQATGLGRGKLRKMAEKNGFKFKSGADQQADWAHKSQTDEAKDARHVDRLKAFSAAGVTRQQAAKHMGTSINVVIRLINQYAIDYPTNNTWRG
jgi:transposase